MVLFTALVVIRLGHVQLLQAAYYRSLAEQNRLFAQSIPAQRGVLLDRYGQPLTQNRRLYFVTQTNQLFAPQLPVERETALAMSATQSGRLHYQLVRNYVLPTTFAHVIGYAGAATVEDLQSDKNLLPIDQVGRIGLEKSLENRLHGVTGQTEFEINAPGQIQRVIDVDEPVSGQLVTTTLDPYLSLLAQRAMGQAKGVVVILDATNGHILTLLSQPSFDANDFQAQLVGSQAEASRQKRVTAYFADQDQVFFNRAVTGAYPPGSLFKLVTALGGLEHGVITDQTEVDDQGTLKVGEYEYANWYYTQYGRVEGKISLERALARSNDIYFYKAAELLGPDKLAATARLYGFGVPTGIELGSEATGLVPDPAWKEKTLGEPWYLGNTFHYGIGQGDILVTPLQMAQLFQAIAHRQVLCQPTLLADKNPICHDLGVSAAATETVLRGMLAACSTGGTAFPFFTYNQQHHVEGDVYQQLANGAVACKTGTAEFGAADGQGYRKTHAWFGAIVQVPPSVLNSQTNQSTNQDASASTQLSPTLSDMELHQQWLERVKTHGFPNKLVMVVLVESQEAQPFMEGSRNAAPVAKKIVDWLTTQPSAAPLATASSLLSPTPTNSR